ncbi:MAG: hypothetical protein L0Y79_13280 [Chlorobi bacterium]|nr:hypothetical protein [Chlorobiota bacterium]MCI0716257.1 hypothetical protein [Chlorobiota bacterium]
MKIEDFKLSLKDSTPPKNLNLLLLALYGMMPKITGIRRTKPLRKLQIKRAPGFMPACSRQAYLHRKEGDFINASYWYSKAGREMPRNLLKENGNLY